ncbi:MAG: helicase-associated domain-containing protein [Candidatus Nanopelagicales bacterium]
MAVVRSLADDLRARTDDQLAALVLARPDLLQPVPGDLTALGSRAGSIPSVGLCLSGYDQVTLHVALAAALGPDPVRTGELEKAMAGGLSFAEARRAVRASVARLRSDGLLWGTDRSLHLVGAAREILVPADRGPRVAALDPVVAGYVRDPGSLRALLDDCPAGVTPALDRLLTGAVIGTVADPRRVPDPARSPIDWLLAHHLLMPLGTDRVAIPAEVVAILRDAPPTDPAHNVADLARPRPERPPVPDADPGAVGAILDVLHGVGELGELWAADPPTRLRTGGIALRDLTRTARALGTTEPAGALLIEVASAAGIIAADSHEEITVLPTAAFDTWRAEPPDREHAALLIAWLNMPRASARAGQRPLSAELAAPRLPAMRREVLAVLAGEPGDWDLDEILAGLRWRSPRRAEPDRREVVQAMLGEARQLGVLVSGTLTQVGLALLADDPDEVSAALARSLPGQVDRLVMQADLTAIVPGLPTPALGALLRSAADPESVGAASVYRFSAASVRRALDAGRTAAEILGDLGRRGSVPQPLAYLIEDVARRHALLRVGSASSFLRCDDPAVLAGILVDPLAAGLELFRLTDTVLASTQPAQHVLDRLRQLGHAPQPEPGHGPAAAGPRRAQGRRGQAETSTPLVTPALAGAAVRAMRAGDPDTGRRRSDHVRGHGSAAQPVPITTPAAVVATLYEAIAADAPVLIGYADPTGIAGDRRIEPLSLSGGYLTAMDLRTERITTFAVARITGVIRA